MTVTIHVGDCRELLRAMPDRSVHCCVTSPPYFGLRDYDVPPSAWPEVEFMPLAGMPTITIPAMECCLGLETDLQAFVGHLVLVFRELYRVLRDDGTLWLNLGDSYAGTGGRGPQTGALFKGRARQRETITTAARVRGDGLKEKDLVGVPWRVALALQADGWYLRQDVIWSKPNPMPESVNDRCTKAHEYVFLLSKSPRYYFDADAIAEPLAASSVDRLAQPNLANQAGSDRVPGKTNGPMKAVRAKGNRKTFRGGGVYTQGQSFDNDASACNDSVGNAPNERDVRNRRSVWTVATQPFKEAHYATFPPELIKPCILASCPAGGVVLDPFGGSGTTGMVSDELGRDAILMELNPGNGEMARRRVANVQPGLALGGTAA